jgi:hypothetical protein
LQAGGGSGLVQSVLKENESLKKSLTEEQRVLMHLGKPDFQAQATLKLQGAEHIICPTHSACQKGKIAQCRD